MLFLLVAALPTAFTQFDFPDFPHPPWHHRPHFGHWRHHPPPWLFPPFLSPPPPPPPAPPVVAAPLPATTRPTSPFTDEMQKVIRSINRKSEHFSRSGENYENVLNILRTFYTKRSGIQYDLANFKQPTVTGRSEFSANQRTAAIFYENDVVLTLSQAKMITTATNRRKRKIIADVSKRWPRTISFRFQENDEEWKTSIRSAISVFTSSTCLSFIENGPSRDFIIFTQGEGCYSSVGKLGGSQEISIGLGCNGEGVISHEISHALGLWHEQSRADRDSFVKIFPQNVITGAAAQFERLNNSISADYGIPYDYGSVMHYPYYAFVRQSGLTSLEPTDRNFKYTIGSRISLSFLDIKAINQAYCSNVCRQQLSCQNNGYAHPNACTRCLCPNGFSGKFCENLEYSANGRDLTATAQWQFLSYNANQNTFWRIRVPHGDRIAFEVTNVWFKCSPSCEEFLEIKYGHRMDQTGSRLCCRKDFGQRTSFSNQMLIIAHTSSQSNFTLNYKLVSQQRTSVTSKRLKPSAPRTASLTWSGWSAWSACTELCGACGKESRTRNCVGSSCGRNSRQSQTRTCNLNACKAGTTRGQPRRHRSLLESSHRFKRQNSWCCAGYKKISNSWCSPV